MQMAMLFAEAKPLIGWVGALLAAAPLWAADSVPESYRIAERPFAMDARGPYQTGTREELWIDSQREESTTSDPTDKRHLMIQLWYPAAFKGDRPRAPYVLHRELYPTDQYSEWLDVVKQVRTHSVLNAPMAGAPQRFPVLIYNPGGYHPHFSGTFQTEFLASHGYIVVAIGHTGVGMNRIERFTDGSVYRPDRNDPRLSDAENAELPKVEWLERQVQRFSELMMPEHVHDIGFVLDRLRMLDADRGSFLHQRLDLDQVGALGWSLGGASSLQASRDDPRIKAAVNLDGWLYTDVMNTGTPRPILQMHGGAEIAELQAKADAASLEQATVAASYNWRLYTHSTGDWYDVTLDRATHAHFSDRVLFEQPQPRLMHPRVAHDIVNGYTLEFFDKYLRDRTHTPLLSGTSSYPEAQLRSRAR
jgi:predicted dienelactone hydrolase